jgi:tellurite resistance protein
MEIIEIIHKRFLELAYLIASSDGELDLREEEKVQEHLPEEISKVKNNELIKETKEQLNKNELSYTNSIKELNELCRKDEKIFILNLLFDVVTVDGVVKNEEIKLLENISGALLIENVLFEDIKEKKLIQANIESFSNLIVDEKLSNEEKINFLKKEFIKWNNRLNSLPAGIERDNAQAIINDISEQIIELSS